MVKLKEMKIFSSLTLVTSIFVQKELCCPSILKCKEHHQKKTKNKNKQTNKQKTGLEKAVLNTFPPQTVFWVTCTDLILFFSLFFN